MSETLPPGRGNAPATWHLSAELCRRFLELRVSPHERRAVIRHLITQCSECLNLVERIRVEGGYHYGKLAAGAYAEGDYAQAFQTALKFASEAVRRTAFERLRGWAQWSVLDPLQPDERFSVIVEHKAWHHWGLFRALLDAAHWYSARDPHEAADIAQLALDITDLLSPVAVGGDAEVSDMQARAWAVLADCHLLAENLAGARGAIASAWKCVEGGTGDHLDSARIHVCEAAYTAATGKLESAVSILEKALAFYQAADDPHLQGRTLIQMATTIGPVNVDQAIAYIEQGLNLVNAVREPRLHLCAQHSLAELLCAAGREEEALAFVDRLRFLYRQFPDDWAQLRLHWLQGRITHAVGHFAEAVHILHQAQQEFRARDLRRDFLMITIDLAEAHVAAGKLKTGLRVLAKETKLLTSWNLHRNALAAWLLLHKTLEERQADGPPVSDIFGRVRLYYRRYWHVPAAEFSLPNLT